MKRKVYFVCIFIIVFTTVTSGIVFEAYKKSNDFKEAEREIEFLEDILIRETINYRDEGVLEDMLWKYSEVLNANIKILYGDGTSKNINYKDSELIYKKEIDIYNDFLNKIEINLYEEKFSNNYIRNLMSAMIISIIIALFFVNRFIEDDADFIEKLDVGIKKIITGDYSSLELNRKEEIYLDLQKDFNIMINHIKSKEDKYKILNTRLKSIISSMNEGIVAVDLDNKIILTNDFADYILGTNNLESLDEIDNKNILEGLDLSLNNPTKVISLDSPISKKIRVSISPIIYYKYSNRKLGYLYIFEDITQVDKLEKVRRDFIANISHELKTPLTSILGYVETLKNSGFEDENFTSKALGVIDDEVMRMNYLLEDLLMLSEIESYNVDLDKGKVNLYKLIEDVFLLFEDEASKNNIRLEKNILDKNLSIYSDEKYIRQIIMNLVSNSIKYNKAGGFVCVTVTRAGDKVLIDVLDNGRGIKNEDRSRVFERFYRGDKSRSSDIDGTGLGLSIVKHIVSLLSGEIFIESVENKGTLVTVKLSSI